MISRSVYFASRPRVWRDLAELATKTGAPFLTAVSMNGFSPKHFTPVSFPWLQHRQLSLIHI